MKRHLSCRDTCHVGTPVLKGHYLWNIEVDTASLTWGNYLLTRGCPHTAVSLENSLAVFVLNLHVFNYLAGHKLALASSKWTLIIKIITSNIFKTHTNLHLFNYLLFYQSNGSQLTCLTWVNDVSASSRNFSIFEVCSLVRESMVDEWVASKWPRSVSADCFRFWISRSNCSRIFCFSIDISSNDWKSLIIGLYHTPDFIECFETTFLRAHSWLNWVDEDDDEDEVGLKENLDPISHTRSRNDNFQEILALSLPFITPNALICNKLKIISNQMANIWQQKIYHLGNMFGGSITASFKFYTNLLIFGNHKNN